MAIDVFDPEYIAKVGFPIAAFVAAFGIVTTIATLIIRSQLKRQDRLDICLDTKLDKYDNSLKEMHDELTNIVIEMKTVSTKIDIYIDILDQHFGSKNVTYVFREGKIDKIKNIIEAREVTQDIEKMIDKGK